MTTTAQKIERALEILEAKGLWTPKLDDAIREEARTCDGKDSARKIVAAVLRKKITAA
jgi:hypothetical protein